MKETDKRNNKQTSVKQLSTREAQPMYQHLSKCEHFAHIIGLQRLPDIDASAADINNKQHFPNVVNANFCVLDSCCNWSQLLFLESLYIKNKQHANLFYIDITATDLD